MCKTEFTVLKPARATTSHVSPCYHVVVWSQKCSIGVHGMIILPDILGNLVAWATPLFGKEDLIFKK
jgi:hypothetical protein